MRVRIGVVLHRYVYMLVKSGEEKKSGLTVGLTFFMCGHEHIFKLRLMTCFACVQNRWLIINVNKTYATEKLADQLSKYISYALIPLCRCIICIDVFMRADHVIDFEVMC